METRSAFRKFSVFLSGVLALAGAHPFLAAAAQTEGEPEEAKINFILSKMDEGIRQAFQKAWQISGGGIADVEGVVLLYRQRDGSLRATPLGRTNERLQSTFQWNYAILAIVHTHPNHHDPRPGGEDSRIADRFDVPVFTITSRGMFVYNPRTRKIAKVFNGMEWHNPARQTWEATLAVKK